jgi:hypothetical protein
VPNGAAGVVLEMGVSRNVVGGRRDGAGNIVSGNRGAGVVVYDFSDQGTRGNKVLGNIVGLGTRGARGLGNGLSGLVVIGAMDTVLGAPGAGNVVAGNHDMGISVNEGTGNRIAANSYGPNGRLAVDLGGDGVTPNDPGDSDGGPNRLQNMPTVLRVTDSAVRGVLNSVADTTFVVEVQRVRSCGGRSPSTILARRSVTTNAHGHARFTIRLPSPLPGGSGVFAGATDPSGDSSELSPCRSV